LLLPDLLPEFLFDQQFQICLIICHKDLYH
jgi:hypothetical protein